MHEWCKMASNGVYIKRFFKFMADVLVFLQIQAIGFLMV